jgi:hypothetical protein
VLAELGQGLRPVLVQAGEHGEGRVPEAAFRAFAAEPAVEAPDGGAYLAAEVGPFSLAGPLFSCTLLHRSLVYLIESFVYLNIERGFRAHLRSAPGRETRGLRGSSKLPAETAAVTPAAQARS